MTTRQLFHETNKLFIYILYISCFVDNQRYLSGDITNYKSIRYRILRINMKYTTKVLYNILYLAMFNNAYKLGNVY